MISTKDKKLIDIIFEDKDRVALKTAWVERFAQAVDTVGVIGPSYLARAEFEEKAFTTAITLEQAERHMTIWGNVIARLHDIRYTEGEFELDRFWDSWYRFQCAHHTFQSGYDPDWTPDIPHDALWFLTKDRCAALHTACQQMLATIVLKQQNFVPRHTSI